MTALVLIDHEGGAIKQPSRSAVAAATKLGEVHALVAGNGAQEAAAAAAKRPGVAKVLVADGAAFANSLAEPMAALMVALAPAYSHLMAATTANGKNVMPRVAAADVLPAASVALTDSVCAPSPMAVMSAACRV
jgi:electron transfer flavoprotein alpha subunit